MHLESFPYQIRRFENYFGLFIPLQAEKSSKLKKTSRRDIFNFSVFFHIQSYLIFQKCIWNHFHNKCEDLKAILDFSFAYKKKIVQNSKNVAPGHFQFFRFFSCSILFNICKMHLELFSYQMWRFEKYYGTFIAYKSMTNCQHKHYLLEYFLKKISTHQKMLKITTFMFYFAGIIHSFKIKPTFWEGNYFVKLNLVCNSLKSHKFNHNFVTSTFKSNFEASYIIFYGS